MALTTEVFRTGGKPDQRILLRCLAEANECYMSIREYQDGITSIQGEHRNTKKVSKLFYDLVNRAMLKQAIVTAQYPEADYRTVQADFMRGYVDCLCERLTDRKPNTNMYSAYSEIGFVFANGVNITNG